MGRAKKRGMDYFPVDVSLMDSTEIKVLTAKFGAEGFYLYMFLMCRIHLGGYYLEVSEDFISCTAVDTRLKEKTVEDMIELMCAYISRRQTRIYCRQIVICRRQIPICRRKSA